MELSDAMLKYVWGKIDSLPEGETLIIKKLAPNRPDLFVECAKKWIDQFKLGEFNKKYTKFKKLSPNL